jgi:hypothetical protein
MPFALLIIGAVLLISAARGTTETVASSTGGAAGPGLFVLIESDFTGTDNFIFWFVAILLIGALGYVQKLRPLSIAFLALVIIVLFLRRGTGFFSQFVSAISTSQVAAPSNNVAAQASQGGSSLTSLLSGIEGSNPVLPSPVTSSSPVASAPTQSSNLLSFPSLSPASSSTDLSFPALGIG